MKRWKGHISSCFNIGYQILWNVALSCNMASQGILDSSCETRDLEAVKHLIDSVVELRRSFSCLNLMPHGFTRSSGFLMQQQSSSQESQHPYGLSCSLETYNLLWNLITSPTSQGLIELLAISWNLRRDRMMILLDAVVLSFGLFLPDWRQTLPTSIAHL